MDNEASENEDTVTAVESTEDGDEVEGHSMAISANFSIDIGGSAVPGTSTDPLKQAREPGTSPTPTPPIR